ncbi:MAG: uracil-DNA glycosylase family protein, partial [Fimbriimonadaceae bacterium]|nr:uracil-DNA glycosylase family protein [Fimbriimonadaceae bacterium]
AATCHCAPPDNKPTLQEMANCAPYLHRVIHSKTWDGILCLGQIAWNAVHRQFDVRPTKFAHAAESEIRLPRSAGTTRVVASYHPSQQNTFTGRLTEPMMDAAIARWKGVPCPATR